jgi:hypothetical protein
VGPDSEPELPTGDHLTVLLSYIEKLDRAYVTASGAASRLLVVQIALSTFLIALSLGIVSANNEVSLSGLKFSAPLWALLITGSALALGIGMMFWSSVTRAAVLEYEIVDFYSALGLEVPAPRGDSNRSPWASGGPLESVVVFGQEHSNHPVLGVLEQFSTHALVLGVTALPVVASALAAEVCAKAFGGGRAWLLLAIPLAALLSAISAWARAISLAKSRD